MTAVAKNNIIRSERNHRMLVEITCRVGHF